MPNLVRLSREDGKNMFLHLSTLLINECPKFFAGEVLVQGLHSLKELVIEGGGKFNMLAGFQCLVRINVSCERHVTYVGTNK